jgi:hypothetical protein
MDSENKELEIVMGDDSEINISEVGDIVNTLKPHPSEKKKNIIIPVSKKKIENNNDQEENEEKK